MFLELGREGVLGDDRTKLLCSRGWTLPGRLRKGVLFLARAAGVSSRHVPYLSACIPIHFLALLAEMEDPFQR